MWLWISYALVVICVAEYNLNIFRFHLNSEHSKINIPPGFLIGTGSSAHQIEGAWNVSDKGINVWDDFTHKQPWKIADGNNGDIACDSYHKYKEDVQLLKTLGVNFYKFSISWSRILPTGYANVVSQDGINYYKNLINELHSNGIEPFVTLYHWDHPEILERLGGWTNELMVNHFVDYARVIFRELGPKVKHFTTINEPSIYCPSAYGELNMAPGKNMTHSGQYLCGHNILKAHARTYHMYNDEFRAQQKGYISILITSAYYYSLDKEDHLSQEIAFQYDCGWFAHPIFSAEGDYPSIMKYRILENSKGLGHSRSILPKFSEKWIKLIRGTADFFTLNYYTSYVVYPINVSDQPYYNYIGLNKTSDPSWKQAGSSWLNIVPDGFSKLLRKIKEEYNNPPVYVLENGCSDINETLNDEGRIEFLYSYMKEMFNAMRDGCDVKAYSVFSFLDNFEWAQGYSERFGLVHVNFTDPERKRTLKSSALWIKQVIKSRKLVPHLQ